MVLTSSKKLHANTQESHGLEGDRHMRNEEEESLTLPKLPKYDSVTVRVASGLGGLNGPKC